MMRAILLVCVLVMSVAGSLQVNSQLRYLRHGSQTVASLLDVKGAAVVYVVQPEDCLGSGARLGVWTALHRAGKVPVRAAVVGGGLSSRQRDLFARYDVQIPLASISPLDAAILAEKLGYASTPFAVVLDRRGRVAASFPAQKNLPPEVVRLMVDVN